MAEVKLSGCVDRGSHSLTLPEKAFDAHEAESPAAKHSLSLGVPVRRPGGPWLGRTRRQTSARLAARSRPAGVEQIIGRATTQSVPGGVGSCFPFTKEELSAVPDRRTASARPLPVSERDGSETLRGGRGPDTRVG